MQAVIDFYKLQTIIKACKGKRFLLCDENTFALCYEVFCEQISERIPPIVIKAGEEHKNINTCEFIWQTLLEHQAGKDSLLINLGGGVVTDVGGFVAATYKRGIKYVNIPTSLLAMVDAATGGKTGINFNHLKNIIGVIQQPELVMLHYPFLKTLPAQHLKNGFAEMLKHALLNSSELVEEILSKNDLNSFINENAILKSLAIKEAIVAQDPGEKGLRKILNLGHTIGHAIEFAAQENKQSILHGEAVALGLIAALKLSVSKMNFDQWQAEKIITFIRHHYPTPTWLKSCYKAILNAVLQDKKNSEQQINMVLLQNVGKPVYNTSCTIIELEQALTEI